MEVLSDDTIIFAHSREALAVLQIGLEWFIESTMRLKFSKWSIIPVANGVSFLGYRIWPKYKLLLRPSVVRAKRKINRYRKQGLTEQLERFLASWLGRAKWANSFNLMNKLGVA
jgi:RNA-directed DNA polymerase